MGGGHVGARLPAVPELGPVRICLQRERLQDSEHLLDAVRGAVPNREALGAVGVDRNPAELAVVGGLGHLNG